MSLIRFNNCKNRDHRGLYSVVPFYDLYSTGPQANKAPNLTEGQTCIVASKAGNAQDRILSWYSFSHEKLLLDNENKMCRVFFGTLLKSETLSKDAAAQHESYSAFFDINGNFKRPSVITSD